MFYVSCCQTSFRNFLFSVRNCALCVTNETWMDGAVFQNNRQSRCVFVLLYKKKFFKIVPYIILQFHVHVHSQQCESTLSLFFHFSLCFICVCWGNSEEFKSTQYMFCVGLYLRWIKCLHHLLYLFFSLLPEWIHTWIKECRYWSPGQSIICYALHCFSRCNSLCMFSS